MISLKVINGYPSTVALSTYKSYQIVLSTTLTVHQISTAYWIYLQTEIMTVAFNTQPSWIHMNPATLDLVDSCLAIIPFMPSCSEADKCK